MKPEIFKKFISGSKKFAIQVHMRPFKGKIVLNAALTAKKSAANQHQNTILLVGYDNQSVSLEHPDCTKMSGWLDERGTAVNSTLPASPSSPVSKYVCIDKNTVAGSVKLIYHAPNTSLAFYTSREEPARHMKEFNLTCSVHLYLEPNMKTTLKIYQSTSLLGEKSFRNKNPKEFAEIVLGVNFFAHFFRGFDFRCVWEIEDEESGASYSETKHLLVPIHKSIENVRPNVSVAYVGKPIECVYDGYPKPQVISWLPAANCSKNMSKMYDNNTDANGSILRILKVGSYGYTCETVSYSNGKEYIFAKIDTSVKLEHVNCPPYSSWVTEEKLVSTPLFLNSGFLAVLYGCVVNDYVEGVVRLVIWENLMKFISREYWSSEDGSMLSLSCNACLWFHSNDVNISMYIKDNYGTILSMESFTSSRFESVFTNASAVIEIQENHLYSFACILSFTESIGQRALNKKPKSTQTPPIRKTTVEVGDVVTCIMELNRTLDGCFWLADKPDNPGFVILSGGQNVTFLVHGYYKIMCACYFTHNGKQFRAVVLTEFKVYKHTCFRGSSLLLYQLIIKYYIFNL
ncbi:hypothetical protein HELRODRAFT_161960 [Helobdella robusta]|uniref:Uncharacterized protein n=1 Tax=Helobdella robusta TaxID=6412 RepID=T1ES33_HELRO|nr:hypothetical protein HELRODRAFT_161960 [Helobdella robusta]ESO02669.1 hypothetical protein HELRODRAFT_161960 [Helobdella robusta]